MLRRGLEGRSVLKKFSVVGVVGGGVHGSAQRRSLFFCTQSLRRKVTVQLVMCNSGLVWQKRFCRSQGIVDVVGISLLKAGVRRRVESRPRVGRDKGCTRR